MRKMALSALALIMAAGTIFAKGGDDSTKMLLKQIEVFIKLQDSVRKVLKYETGSISLPSGVAKLNVPKGFKYLGIEQSRYVIQELWGNLEQTHLQGMIFSCFEISSKTQNPKPKTLNSQLSTLNRSLIRFLLSDSINIINSSFNLFPL